MKLNDLKIEPYSLSVLKKIAEDFKNQCHSSLNSQNKSLTLLNSKLKKIRNFQGDAKHVLSIDIGGTRIRLGIFQMNKLGYMTTAKGTSIFDIDNASLEKDVIKKVGEHKYETDMDTYSTLLASVISEYLSKNSTIIPDEIGVVFSFPAEIIENNGLIDATREKMSDEWGKSFYVHNSSTNISARIRSALETRNIVFRHWVTLNDVIAVHLVVPEAKVSLIVGTGFNIGVMDKDGYLFNTESGFFNNSIIEETASIPAQKFLEELKADINEKGQSIEQATLLKRINEVQISGGFLFILFAYALSYLGEENIDLLKSIGKLKTESLSMFLQGRFSDFEKMFNVRIPDFKRPILRGLSSLLFERSTDLVAAQLSGAIMFSKEELNIDAPFKVAVDGSVIKKMPGYKAKVEQKCMEILGTSQLALVSAGEASLKGAAVAALST